MPPRILLPPSRFVNYLFAVCIVANIGLFVVLLSCDTVSAEEQSKCEIDDWRAYNTMGGMVSMVTIEGTTTCPAAMINMRLYHGSKFIAVATAYSQGHVFDVLIPGIDWVDGISIKSVVEPEVVYEDD